MRGGGVAVCNTTCEYGRLHASSGGLLSFHRPNPIIASKPHPLIGCNRSIPPFTQLRVSGSRGGGRPRMMTMNAAATDTLQKGIAEFYDESSGVWEDIWGDHMHHGFYEPGSDVSLSDHRAAQIRMIEESLRFASLSDDSVQKPRNIVDVGCGIGGSSRYLARKYGAKCKGITLSPVQAQRAQELAAAQGLDGKVSFQVADALNQPFPDGEFDLVWSMESGEHMPDKTKDIKAADWSQNVAPFWPAVIKSALSWKGITSLFRTGNPDLCTLLMENNKGSAGDAIDD
ncbi:putative tocopherol O-methyltransferase, chloroplastic [Sesamum angolense]|uniref:Tocopherol O-methyltransferase, chloroplastic n=1 Tax=Sesamum angolense TaxID=2727404 RepID=A0AAE1WNB3_9LAMI|nr:putative tocopherol O-methyltransferase, chloroplastic [Sesamum angolense]